MNEKLIKRKYTEIKYRNKKKFNSDVILSYSDFKLLSENNCFYCNEKNNNNNKVHGLDRVDNNKHYSLDNVVLCCYYCNRMKYNFKENEFKNHINKIYKNNLKKRFKKILTFLLNILKL